MIDQAKLINNLNRSIELADKLATGHAKMQQLHPDLDHDVKGMYENRGKIVIPLEKNLGDFWRSLPESEFRPIVAVIRAAQCESPDDRGKYTIDTYISGMKFGSQEEEIDHLLRKAILHEHLRRGMVFLGLS